MNMQRRTRRGSAYVSPVSSSSSEEEDAAVRRGSQWRRRRPQPVSSSSSSNEEDELEQGEEDDGDTDELEDFVGGRRASGRRASVAKLDRLRRIFLNQPSKRTTKPTKKRCEDDGNQDAQSTTTSNSSGENVAVASVKREGKQDSAPAVEMTLAIGHHVAALRDQVQRLARHHDAHAQQWQAMVTQAIEELTFVKQQEERALQSHARLVQESYALRLEIFEQQYRAKVAEIRDAMRAEIAQQRRQSEAAVVAAAQRLQQQTQQLFQAEEPTLTADLPPPAVDKSAVLAKTTAFLDRQRAREDARRRRAAETSAVESTPVQTTTVLSPVSRQRAKLRALEQKLATFSPATVDRVVRTVEQQARERRESRHATPVATATSAEPAEPSTLLRAAPLSPLRRRESYWHNGISREDPAGSVLGAEEPKRPPQSVLSRRFLRPEEERELLALRNRIGLAKDWMEQHAGH